MSTEKPKSVAPSSRFEGGVPHYHRSNRSETTEWDEWTGDPVKGAWRQKFDYMLYAMGAVIVGCILFACVIALIFFFWRKVFPMIN